MTRYSNPLPHNQVPNTQGRPAGAAPFPGQAPQPRPEAPAWPQPGEAPRTGGRPAAHGYGDTLGYAPDPQHGQQQHDPYAALRPDGYGYAQPSHAPQAAPAEPYGLAGYTAPQAQAPQGYAPRAAHPAPQAPAPAQPRGGYAPTPHDGFGAAGGPAAPSPYAGAPYSAAQPSHHAPQPAHAHGYAANPQAYAQPQQPGYGGFGAADGSPGYGAARADLSGSESWGPQGLGGAPNLSLDARDYGHYGAAQEPPQGQWGGDPYGEPQLDPSLGAGGYAAAQHHPQHGGFDQSYAEDDVEYEDEPRRGGWKKVVALVACTFVVGGVLTVAYSTIMGSNSSGPTPLVKGAEGPAKVKPSDPGGKQFAHADSKIMGRLSEKEAEEADPQGVRKVPVVVVGRDGSIQPPATASPAEDQPRAVVAVPGLTVIDGLDGPSPSRPAAPAAPAAQRSSPPPVQMVASSDAAPPGAMPVRALSNPSSAETGAVPAKAQPAKAEPVVLPKKEKVAALPAATGPRPTGAGYVAVLASVPASGSSRIDALKQFADMQQRYGTILQNKTPDIQEANLGEKGTYHRLMVGPPGSRDSANSVCAQLKAEGYSGCWITAY